MWDWNTIQLKKKIKDIWCFKEQLICTKSTDLPKAWEFVIFFMKIWTRCVKHYGYRNWIKLHNYYVLLQN